jgi:hypothetical protein
MGDGRMTRQFSQLVIFNVCAAALVVAGWKLGYVQDVFLGDQTGISYVTASLLFLTLGRMLIDVWRNRDLPYINEVSEWAVSLGIVATCFGLVTALTTLGSADLNSPEAVVAVARPFLAGIGTAFCGTLTGIVAALWLRIAARAV